MEKEEYDIIEIQGVHGLIKLHVPKGEPTEEEILEAHRSIAEIIVDAGITSKKKEATD